jgi:hypothetical protein
VRPAVLLLALAACSGRASNMECDQATDRMIDIFTAPRVSETGKVSPEAQQASDAWSKNLKEKDPTKATLMDTCRKRMTPSDVACVLKASDEKTLATCFE